MFDYLEQTCLFGDIVDLIVVLTFSNPIISFLHLSFSFFLPTLFYDKKEFF